MRHFTRIGTSTAVDITSTAGDTTSIAGDTTSTAGDTTSTTGDTTSTAMDTTSTAVDTTSTAGDTTSVAYPSSQGNKWRLKLVQFNGLFNNPRTLSYTSTQRRLGNENALKPQLIQSQLHIIQVH